MSIYMVEAKKKRKRKAKPRAGQVISQKVVVNVGNKGYSTRRRTGTQAKRSTQPQVIYQNAPIPLMPDYSSQLNDLRNEVRASRIVSIAQPEQRTGIIAPREKIEKIAKQEGVQGTDVQTEREVGRVMETMQQATQDIETRTAKIAAGKIKKAPPVMTAEEKERFSMEAEDINRGKKPRARRRTKVEMEAERQKKLAKARMNPVEGVPIPQEIEQVAVPKPREFQEGSLLANLEGAQRLPQAKESKLASRVARRGVSFTGDVGGGSGSDSDEYQRYLASTGGRSRSSFSGRQSFSSEGFQSAEEEEEGAPLAQGSFI
jgi:hypothetical protein